MTEGLVHSQRTDNGGAGIGASERGFTLLELVIAITLVATILLVISGAVRLAYRSMGTGERKMESLERFRASLTVIDSQIQSGIPLTYEDNGVKRLYFEGSRSSLKFATNYSIWSGRSGYVIVQYTVSPDQNGKLTMYATENVIGTAMKRQTMLLAGLDQMYFEYLSRDIVEEGQWIDQWTDDSKTPEMIRLRLLSGSRDFSIIIPMRAEATITAARLDMGTTGGGPLLFRALRVSAPPYGVSL